MIRAILILTLLAAFLLQVSPQSNKNEIPTVIVGQVSIGQLYKVDRYKAYHLINVNSIDKKYLFFSLKTEQVYEGFNLSMTIYKQGTQSPLVHCEKEEVDSCYLYKDQVFLNETLFIVVECGSQEEIQYKLRSYWSDLEHLRVGQNIRFIFSEKQQRQIYHLQLEGMQFQELRIIIRPETRRYPFDKIKMYGTFGPKSNPAASHYDFKSFPLWEDAEGIYLYRREIKDLTMNLIIYGQTKIVYSMRCELVNKTHGDLGINEKIYEYLQNQERYLYHLKFKDEKNNYFYQKFVFRIAIFTGDLEVKFFSDQERKKKVEGLVLYAYMGDMQYALNNKTYLETVLPNGLYISVESVKRVSTFMLEFQGRQKSEALELHQHIYQFLPVQTKQLAYINVGQYADQKTEKGRFTLIFTDVSVVGRINVQFRFCKKTVNECLGPNYVEYSDKVLTQVKQVGSKITYTLQLAQSMFKSVNIVEQKAVIVVVMANMLTQAKSFSAVEYNVGNRTQYLRENKPIESYARRSQLKVYKYLCQDPLIKKIRVHINKISGSFDTFALRKELSPQEQTANKYGKLTGSVVQFTDKLLQLPIVLIIVGIESSTYSIVVQPIHSESSQVSYITLSEDVQFKMKIAANKFEVFEIVPISANIYFNYKSTGPLHVCTLNQAMVCQEQNFTSLQNQGSINITNFYNRRAYIKVRNPLARTVEVKSIFHSKQEEHCELVKMGHVVSQILTVGKCLYTVIDSLQGFEAMLVHSEYGHFEYKTVICSQLVNIATKQSNSQRFYISATQLQKNCQGHAEYTFSFVVVGNISRIADGKTVQAEKLFVKYLIQYLNSILVIPDGLGYHSTQPSTQAAIKKFAYSLVNFINTTIVVTTRNKLIFLVKVIQSSEREKIVLNFNDYHFSSSTDRYYFLESIHLTISASQLLQYRCTECQLLIFLYSQETVGQVVDFTIQVTQNFQILEDGLHNSNYLTQDSKAFYSYNVKRQGEVLIELSDNNENCAELYVSRTEYPDQNNYDKKSFDGEIIYENKRSQPTTLYISVKARKNCAYSVGASLLQGSIKIKKLERGVLNPLSMKQGEVRYYTFKHLSDNAFKVLSLHKYGSIQFYLNKTSPEVVGYHLKQNKIDYQAFQHKSPQKNRLHLTKSSKFFCKDCFYILAAYANKPTDSSIFLADQQTRIPISEEKVINDILPQQGSFSRCEFYAMQKGIVQVKLHSGKLQVDLKYKNQTFSKVFQKLKSEQFYKFTLQGQNHYGSVQAIFKALSSNTIYSLRIYKDKQGISKDGGRLQTIVNPSEPNYFYINGQKPTVLKGYLKSRQDRIFISFYSSDKQLLMFMNLTGTLNGKPSDISRDITRNVISISFIEAQTASFQKGIPYQLIFSLDNQTMSLIAMQTEETSLLPENMQMLISGKQTYDIYPEGEFLLDIFECRGTASLSFSKTRAGLQSQKEKVLESFSMPDQPHAVKIDEGFTNLLIRVTTPLALIRWLPISKEKQSGIGYYLYKAGSLRYDSVFGSIEFNIQPLTKAVQKTKTKINDIKYNLYISSSEQDLKEASLCERYLPASVFQFRTIHQQIYTSSFKFSVDKTKLNDKYKLSQNLFAVIVADLTLTLPDNSSQQNYRFVYNQQEIPKQVFTPTQLENFNIATLSIFLLLLIIALIVFAWLCTKVFVPMIGRLRNRMLVEQNGLDTSKDKDIEIKQEHIEPPPSSQRQKISEEVGPATEEKMG